MSTLESRFEKLWICMLDSLDTCGWKPYPERKSCKFKNIQIGVHVDGALPL